MGANKSNPDQYQLRLPPGLRDRIKKVAKLSGRSLNAEIVETLEAKYPSSDTELDYTIEVIQRVLSEYEESGKSVNLEDRLREELGKLRVERWFEPVEDEK